jgi:hypothetical protein
MELRGGIVVDASGIEDVLRGGEDQGDLQAVFHGPGTL